MKLRGTGFACIHLGTNYHFGMRDEANVKLEMDRDGCLDISTAFHDIGQGIGITLAMIVSEAFGGIEIDQIRIQNPSTDLPYSGSTGASRITTIVGKAVLEAAENLKMGMTSFLSELLDTDPNNLIWRDGKLVELANGITLSLSDIALEAERAGLTFSATGHFVAPSTSPIGDVNDTSFPINSVSYATAVAEVEVNTETGQVRVIKLTSIHDSGTIINPEGAESQVEGGLIMGLGLALMEDYVIDAGIPLTTGFVNYILPSSIDLPEIDVFFVEDAKSFGPYGAKGLAEVPMVVAAPAIINAIYDATKVRITDLPAKPERVLFALLNQRESI